MRKANNGGDQHHEDIDFHYQSIVLCRSGAGLLSKKRSNDLTNRYLLHLLAFPIWTG
jgi:hypothetical protein